MKILQYPPSLGNLGTANLGTFTRVLELQAHLGHEETPYLHWDELRHRTPPEGFTHEQWWFALKFSRQQALRSIPLTDKNGFPFRFAVEATIMEALHQIDMGAGGRITMPGEITNPGTRDHYLVSSLMEEAITSSQLEGAATTREVAKEMIRTGRKPRDNSERMILNNYHTMQHIRQLKDQPLSPEMVFEIHRIVSKGTLEDPTASGRFRRADEAVVVEDIDGEMLHNPPHASGLPQRLEAMCAFANGKTPDTFVHPAVRAMILHFWLAYDHPFVDGNGRTARALFYWAMLHRGYWLFEFLSISSILRKAPAQYGRSFLFTETDDNDLTYFLIAQTKVILHAVKQLHDYIERKTAEARDVESRVRSLDMFNHRQAELLRHALKHPDQRYTFASHRTSHNVTYQTARTDLLDLSSLGLFEMHKRGKQLVFVPAVNLSRRLASLQKNEGK